MGAWLIPDKGTINYQDLEARKYLTCSRGSEDASAAGAERLRVRVAGDKVRGDGGSEHQVIQRSQ